jgi:hypothetical protein
LKIARRVTDVGLGPIDALAGTATASSRRCLYFKQKTPATLAHRGLCLLCLFVLLTAS